MERKRPWWIVILIFFVLLGVAYLGQYSGDVEQNVQTVKQEKPKSKGDSELLEKAIRGALTLKNNARNPDSFVVESAIMLRDTDIVCYTFRAQNGFGGMNRENAILFARINLLKTSEMEGFTKLWNRNCAGKPGEEADITF